MVQESAPSGDYVRQVRFEGKAGEYFGIWIVNVILTVITIGIYSAWAKVRSNRYFYGNTYLDGSAFEYTADPVNILKGRAFAVALLIALQVGGRLAPQAASIAVLGVVLLFPALLVMALRFRMFHTRWRGIRFGFRPDFRSAYLLFLPMLLIASLFIGLSVLMPVQPDPQAPLPPLVIWFAMAQFAVLLIAMLAFPWWQNRYYAFMGNRTRYGSHGFAYTGGAGGLYRVYLVAGLLFLAGPLCGGALFWLLRPVLVPVAAISVAMIPMAILYAASMAYMLAARTNLIYSRLAVGDASLTSRLRFRRMFFLYATNTVAIVLSLGLAIPWAKIRMARYRAETLTVTATSLDAFAGASDDEERAVAEEISDVFDWDIGL